MFQPNSLGGFLARSMLYGCIAAVLVGIGLLLWQAAIIDQGAVDMLHTIYAGPFALIVFGKQTVGSATMATISLGSGWLGYMLACQAGSLLLGFGHWQYKRVVSSRSDV